MSDPKNQKYFVDSLLDVPQVNFSDKKAGFLVLPNSKKVSP